MIEKKILVTYFTASEGRVTERVAKNLAAAVSGDIFEIAAKDRYTKADINWVNPLSRCNKEKLGKKDVEIAGKLQNIQDYDLILRDMTFPAKRLPCLPHQEAEEWEEVRRSCSHFYRMQG